MADAQKIKRDLLLELQKIFDEQDFATIFSKKDGEDYPFDLLTVMLEEFTSMNEDVVGEFFFTEDLTDEKGSKLLFRSAITLAEDPRPDALDRMIAAASLINFYVGAGSFGCDKDGNNMAFVSSFIVPVEDDLDTALKFLVDNIMYILGTCSKFGDYILMAGDNTLSLDELKSQL